jgi:hypothetical protein
MLTAECADTVSDPSEESLLSNAPGVNRKVVQDGVQILVGIRGVGDRLRSRTRFQICFGRGWLSFPGCRSTCTGIVSEFVPTVVDEFDRLKCVIRGEVLGDIVSAVRSIPLDGSFYVSGRSSWVRRVTGVAWLFGAKAICRDATVYWVLVYCGCRVWGRSASYGGSCSYVMTLRGQTVCDVRR